MMTIVRAVKTYVRLLAGAALLFQLATSCSSDAKKEQNTLFVLHPADKTGVHFSNDLSYTEQLNPYTFRNFYNGGGVGIGDFNQDGLQDLFFSGNLVANKLYLNQGDFHFRDITTEAGIGSEGVWTTGVSIVDINGDGLPDIYTCKSGPPGGKNRHNELFINQGNNAQGIPTFSEQAKAYGLDDEGLSTHAAFFDFDKDGDLDLYLLNNSLRSVGGYDLRLNQRNTPDPLGGNKLYRNDGSAFTDISQQAGIYTSAIGFGLGVTIGDINKDGWQDIYVSNDFFERDYLYINNQNGTFSERLESYMREISMGSMGADMADINNDGLPEVFVTEMLPETDERLKTTTQFETWDKYQTALQQGYYHQFSRNALQLNLGKTPTNDWAFAEVSRLAGVHATDWSWGALILDMDNDGLKDIFVANGIYKDLLNQDYVNFIGNPDMVRSILQKKKQVIKELIDSIPSNQVPNYAFHNTDGLHFENKATDWGLGIPSNSNGSAYGDLDNDGDLDLVINNVNAPAFIYENKSRQQFPNRHFLSVSLSGQDKNKFALGAKVTIYANSKIYYQELAPMRGFMSSVDYRLLFGLGRDSLLDSLRVDWPNNQTTLLTNVPSNQFLKLSQSKATPAPPFQKVTNVPVFTSHPLPNGMDFIHHESPFVDFDQERLLFHMISNEGPCAAAADINRDGREDIFIGGAKDQPGALFVQDPGGRFHPLSVPSFSEDKASEDTGCAFFDANGDGYQDLYVASGSNEASNASLEFLDRLYINQQGKSFTKSPQILPSPVGTFSTSTVCPADFDQDGDIDLFVGGRVTPGLYGIPQNGFILQNDGQGNFTDVSARVAPALKQVGMITAASWSDFNRDGAPDLLLTGDWMPLKILLQQHGKFVEAKAGLQLSNGWYHSVSTADLNLDGLPDIIAGNQGLNARFKASEKEPVSLYINDFDQNGTVEQLLTRYDQGKELPLVLRKDLVMQMPFLKKKYLRFENYVNQSMQDIFSMEKYPQTLVLKAFHLETAVWINQGNGTFKQIPLPALAQLAPVYAILVRDFDRDGKPDILLGGNQYRAKPETGVYRSSYGLLLRGDGKGSFQALSPAQSGVWINAQIRALLPLTVNNQSMVFIATNDARPELIHY